MNLNERERESVGEWRGGKRERGKDGTASRKRSLYCSQKRIRILSIFNFFVDLSRADCEKRERKRTKNETHGQVQMVESAEIHGE